MNMFDLMWTWVFVALIASGTTGDYSGIASGTKGDYSDINECEKGVKCGANEVCRNTIGNYTCDCIGGYGRKTRGACTKIEGASFVLSTVWQISAWGDVTNFPDTAENRQKIKQYVVYVVWTEEQIVTKSVQRAWIQTGHMDVSANTDTSANNKISEIFVMMSTSVSTQAIEINVELTAGCVRMFTDPGTVRDTVWMDVGTEETPLYRCQQNHTYVDHVTFISVTDLGDGYIKELVTAKINAALSNNTNEATTDPSLSVRELFVYLTVLNINRTHADQYTNYDVMFTLRFGLPVSAIMLHGVLGSITNLNSNINETYFTVFYDIDECQNTGACLHGRCENIPGSWICHCPQGYENTTSLSYSTICQDINECTTQTLCDNGNCINTNGSWHCDCNIGFKHTDSKNQSCEASTTKSPFDVSTAATPTKPSTLKSPFDVSTAATPTKPSTLKSPFDVSTAATPTKASTSTLSTTTSSTTNENVSGLTTILIATVSSLGGFVAILIFVMGCMCWKIRQQEKTKLAAQHITMDTIGPGHNYNSINQTYNSSQYTYQSVIYNHGEHGSFNHAPYHHSREELSNSENHSSHQHRVSLYQTSSLPRLPPIKRDVGKWLPSGDPHRPRSPASDYLEPASRGRQPNPPSPQLDYMPHDERAF